MPVKEEANPQASVKPASGEKGVPLATKTFTQEEVDQRVRDAKNAALGDIGRLQRESANSLKLAQEAQERVNQMVAEQDRRELDEAQGDPQRLSALQERQARRKVESELAEARSKLAKEEEWRQQTEVERADTKRAQAVQEVAAKFNVDATRLARLAKATDGSVEAIEDLAKDLPTGTPKPSLKPDSGGAIGGHIDRKQIVDNYIKNPRDLKARTAYFELRREEGR